jgi:hypothetical protein
MQDQCVTAGARVEVLNVVGAIRLRYREVDKKLYI